MEQTQFKVRLSVSSKLLLTISTLLLVTIVFLNVSAINLFRNDKVSYVYDNQATTAALTGREFVSYLDHNISNLKLMLGSIDISKEITEQQRNNVKFYMDNQAHIVGTAFYSLNVDSFEAQKYYEYFKPATQTGGTDYSNLKIKTTSFVGIKQEIQKNGFAIQNISAQGTTPAIAIILIEPIKDNVTTTTLSIAYATLAQFLSGSSNSVNTFLVAKQNGDVLFHSDTANIYEHINIANLEIFKTAQTSAVNTGAREYKLQNSKAYLGSFYKPGMDLVTISQIEYEKAMKATNALTEKFVTLALAALGIMIIIGLIVAKRITAPLANLFRGTTQISHGDFNVQIPVTSTDELGALTHSFVSMSGKISELVSQMVDKVRVDQELAIAQTVQQSLFPPTQIDNEYVHIASLYQSASECGGDWWGYFSSGSKHVVIIADATGHGLPSALVTAAARACFSVIEKLVDDGQFDFNPSTMLSIANRTIYDSALGKIMMTCFAAVIDFDKHEIIYASAAHNPPWLFSPSGDGRFKLSSLVASGQRLGEARDLPSAYEVKSMPFKAGDTVVFYTDGLIEGKNLTGDQYGKKQSRALLEEVMGKSPEEALSELMNDFLAHNRGKELDDDVTLAITRFKV